MNIRYTSHVKLLFFMLADIRMGRGGEVVLFNLIKHKPKKIQAVVVQGDCLPEQRMSEEEYSEIIRNSTLITISDLTQ